MPRVTSTAITEHRIMTADVKRSTLWRARKRGARRERPMNSPSVMAASATTAMAQRAISVQRSQVSAAARISGLGSLKIWSAATFLISDSSSCSCAGEAATVKGAGRLATSTAAIQGPWKPTQSSTSTSAGTPTQMATNRPW